MGRAHLAVTTCLAAGLVLGACSGGDDAVDDRVPPPGTVLSDDAFDLVSRSEAFYVEEQALLGAEQLGIAECMQSQGWDYVALPGDQLVANSSQSLTDRRLDDGYGLASAATQVQGSDATSAQGNGANREVIASLSAEDAARYDVALFGHPETRASIDLPDGTAVSYPVDGCIAQARTELYGDIATWASVSNVPPSYERVLAENVLESSAYTAAMRGWSDCMAASGFDYALPQDAIDDLTERYRVEGFSDQLRDEEMRTATADATCAQDEGVESAVDEALRTETEQLPPPDIEQLNDLTQARGAAVRRANSRT